MKWKEFLCIADFHEWKHNSADIQTSDFRKCIRCGEECVWKGRYSMVADWNVTKEGNYCESHDTLSSIVALIRIIVPLVFFVMLFYFTCGFGR